MKVALCLYGYIGTLKGKTDDFSKKTDESSTGDLVLDLSHKHFKKHILDKNDVDVFIHSWEVDKQDEIKRLYEPKSSHFEKQIVFPDEPILDEWKKANVGIADPNTPEGYEKSKKRLQAHLSRWYGTGMSVSLKKDYEEKNDFKYDMVMISRFDVCWMNDVIFNKFDPKYFWIPRVTMEKNTRTWYGWPFETPEINDYWCFSNSAFIDDFSYMFNYIEKYVKPGYFPMWGGISSHFLSVCHLIHMGLISVESLKHKRPDIENKVKFAFDFGIDGEPVTEMDDFTLVRFQYAKDLGIEVQSVADWKKYIHQERSILGPIYEEKRYEW